ncbi:MAG: photosystem reaction center subunit H [Thermoplasmata archaeon]|mgnify:CR=1 FL=1|nr:MAG: photosystem reaction center subunit H [Thermoplasmata archaeon]
MIDPRESVERHKVIEIRELIGKNVYTMEGDYVGRVLDIILSLRDLSISKIIVSYENPRLVPPDINKDHKPLGIPYNWIYGIGDAIILSTFPKFFRRKKEEGS